MCVARRWVFLAFFFGLAVAVIPKAHAGVIDFREGWWRAELTAAAGTYSGKADRDGDYYGAVSFEYEFPAFKRATFGIRIIPVFLYHEDEDEDEEPGTIYGAGFGVTARVYQRAETRDGWFLEMGTGPIAHSNKFEGNSGSVNFLNGIGVGYKFREKPFHVTLRWEHISNASAASDNAGVNSVVLAGGYSF